MKKLSIAVLAALLLIACTNNYSEGNRVGIITKFSQKGLINKSWEGDLKIAPNIANQNGMVGQYEDFLFSIDNDNTIQFTSKTDSINYFMKHGIPVEITYQQVAGKNWFNNRGCTDYFIKSVQRAN